MSIPVALNMYREKMRPGSQAKFDQEQGDEDGSDLVKTAGSGG